MTDGYVHLFQQAAADLSAVAAGHYPGAIAQAVDLLHLTLTRGGKLLVFGNGGSSAHAQHLAAELVGRFVVERRALPAIALTTNQAVLTAWSNDHSFDDVFARQIDALGLAGDVALGISTSGNSTNVVNALVRARSRGLRTIGLTGGDGGRMAPLCDVLLAAPVTSTPRIQEVHLVTYHAICAGLDAKLAGSASA